MPQKKATASSTEFAVLFTLHREATAQDCEEFAAKQPTKKARTVSSAKIPQKHCTEDKADMGLSGGMLQKQSSNVEADTGLSGEMLHQHEHPVEEADTAKDMTVHVKDENIHLQDVQEAELLIQKLNEWGLGEDISDQEFLDYYRQLPRRPRCIDLNAKLKDEDLDKLDVVHALYRLRYYKYKLSQQASKEELHGDKSKEDHPLNLLEEGEEDATTLKEGHPLNVEEDEEGEEDDTTLKEDDTLKDKSEDDCDEEFLEEEGFFKRFEEHKTFDWFFHPDYLECSSLTDYQRLVLRNYGGTEYGRSSDYYTYLHTYEIELEYVKYCEELYKQLKWMEDYLDTDPSSVKGDKIFSRGALQAIKIAATSFHKITPNLAYNGFIECKESMAYDATFKQFVGVYFEIWQWVTQETSFRKALEDVYNLNRFPLRQCIMEAALKFDDCMKMMEEEFHTCTAAISLGVKEGKAQELIAEAVNKLVNKPKSYEQYIRKKIQIACIIGILPKQD